MSTKSILILSLITFSPIFANAETSGLFSVKAGDCVVMTDGASEVSTAYAKVDGTFAQKVLWCFATGGDGECETPSHLSTLHYSQPNNPWDSDEELQCLATKSNTQECAGLVWRAHKRIDIEDSKSTLLSPTFGMSLQDSGNNNTSARVDGYVEAAMGGVLRMLTGTVGGLLLPAQGVSCKRVVLNEEFLDSKTSGAGKFAGDAINNARKQSLIGQGQRYQSCTVKYDIHGYSRSLELFLDNQPIAHTNFLRASKLTSQVLGMISPIKWNRFDDYDLDMWIGGSARVLNQELIHDGTCQELKIVPTGEK